MNVPRTRALLWMTGAALGAVSALTLVYGLAWPLAVVASAEASRQKVAAPATTPTKPAAPELKDLLTVAQREWRKPLYDPPAPAAIDAPKQPATPLTIKLLGTVVEQGHSRAVLAGPDGKPQLKSIGETLGGAEVVEIAPEVVRVRYLGQVIDLQAPAKPQKP